MVTTCGKHSAWCLTQSERWINGAWHCDPLLSTQAFSCPSPCIWAPQNRSLGTPGNLHPTPGKEITFLSHWLQKLIDATVKIKWLAEDYSLTLEFNLECVY